MSKKEVKKVQQEIDKFYLEGFDKWLTHMNPKKKIIINEAQEADIPEGEDKEEQPFTKKMEEKEKDALKEQKDPKDAFKHVDEILKDVDLKVLTNEARKELIEIIIDSAQNSEEEDDDFEQFVEEMKELVDSYQVDGKDEEEEKEDSQELKKERSAKEETTQEKQPGANKLGPKAEIPTGPEASETEPQERMGV